MTDWPGSSCYWPAGIDYASVMVPDATCDEDHEARFELLDLLGDED